MPKQLSVEKDIRNLRLLKKGLANLGGKGMTVPKAQKEGIFGLRPLVGRMARRVFPKMSDLSSHTDPVAKKGMRGI